MRPSNRLSVCQSDKQAEGWLPLAHTSLEERNRHTVLGGWRRTEHFYLDPLGSVMLFSVEAAAAAAKTAVAAAATQLGSSSLVR